MLPGQIALQRIPSFAYIKPIFLVRPTTANLDAVYAAPARHPNKPPTDAVLIIAVSYTHLDVYKRQPCVCT